MPESPEYLEEKIVRLEERLAFQEDTLQKLDAAASDQQRQIMALEEQLKHLLNQFRRLESSIPDAGLAEDEKPPHY
ncbi:MAG: SlyX family protein [Candidatus Azotimanducaceae bacterium WSBS_2022_MAG_OTU7]